VTGLRAALARRRPTSRAGAVKAFFAGVGLFAVLLVGLVGVAVVVPWVYAEYGFHPEENARSWAALTPQYADTAVCQRCHEPQYAAWDGERHASVTCESCHGPLAEHAATAPVEAPAGSLGIVMPDEGLCAICHEQSPAKPAAFAQVDLAEHYAGGRCLNCHDSHSADAVRPPEIPHSLARLPECVTCHAPAGLKPVPDGHVESSDAACQGCHKRPAAGQ
jgi:hypothetical protein